MRGLGYDVLVAIQPNIEKRGNEKPNRKVFLIAIYLGRREPINCFHDEGNDRVGTAKLRIQFFPLPPSPPEKKGYCCFVTLSPHPLPVLYLSISKMGRGKEGEKKGKRGILT